MSDFLTAPSVSFSAGTSCAGCVPICMRALISFQASGGAGANVIDECTGPIGVCESVSMVISRSFFSTTE